VEIDRNATTVTVRTSGRRGPPSNVDLQITAPAWMPLDLSGVNTEMTITGARAGISAETVQGDVTATGGNGLVSLRSVQGSVSLTGAKGRLDVSSVNADVEVIGSSGEVTAETVNGDVTLDKVDATSVTATSLNGDVAYNGPIKSTGRYALSTHNGDVTVTVAEGTSASVSVSTFNGEFESAFPVTLTETRKGKRFNFTIGGGSAQVTLESFQGTIELVRPGQFRGAHEDDGDDE
jgi:DUF4097 and DUF4098 domain-containing protein YvlB